MFPHHGTHGVVCEAKSLPGSWRARAEHSQGVAREQARAANGALSIKWSTNPKACPASGAPTTEWFYEEKKPVRLMEDRVWSCIMELTE